MQNLTTLGKVADQVSAMSATCFDILMPTIDMNFDGIDYLVFTGDRTKRKIRPAAQRQIAARLGVPMSYLAKCPRHIQTENLNYWMEQEKKRSKQLFVRFDGDDIRAFFTRRYEPMDNMKVLERLDEMGFDHQTEVHCALDDEFMSLSIPNFEKTFTVGQRDKMTPGISISNSEVGLASLSISAYVLRLVCTNGMISKTEVSASYRHVSQKVMDEFPEVLANVASEMDLQQSRFAISLQSSVDDPDATINSFNRQFQLKDPEVSAVNWAYPQEIALPATMFNVVNTYTKAGQAPGLNAESRHKLGRVGGAILGMAGRR
jgi:hypothetical protein